MADREHAPVLEVAGLRKEFGELVAVGPRESYTKRLRASVPRPGWEPRRAGGDKGAAGPS